MFKIIISLLATMLKEMKEMNEQGRELKKSLEHFEKYEGNINQLKRLIIIQDGKIKEITGFLNTKGFSKKDLNK